MVFEENTSYTSFDSMVSKALKRFICFYVNAERTDAEILFR